MPNFGDGVTVYPFVYIGPHARWEAASSLSPASTWARNVRIGKGTTVYPHAVLMAGTHVGEGRILHPGSVLGADGFGFARTPCGHPENPASRQSHHRQRRRGGGQRRH